MKKKRFTDEQIIAVLKDPELGASAADLGRKHGISPQMLYNWKSKYGGMDVSEAKRLKGLETENAKLKRFAGRRDARQRSAEGPLVKVTPAEKRKAALHLEGRPACRTVGCDRMTARYRSRRAANLVDIWGEAYPFASGAINIL
jgi:putative transposase